MLFQKEEQTREERDLLQKRLDKATLEVQKRASFKSLLLETKINVLQSDIEKKETALHQVRPQHKAVRYFSKFLVIKVLISTNLQPELLGEPIHRLEDTLQIKDDAIKELQDRLAEIKAVWSIEYKINESYDLTYFG